MTRICLAVCLILVAAGLLYGLLLSGWWKNEPAIYHGMVAVGPPGSAESKLWHFIARQSEIFLDQNADAIPQPAERIDPEASGISTTVGEQSFRLTSVRLGVNPDAVSQSIKQKLHVAVNVDARHPYTMAGALELVPIAAEAHTLSFGGALEFVCQVPGDLPVSNGTQAELRVYLADLSRVNLAEQVEQDTGDGATIRSINAARNFAIVVPDHQPPFPEISIRYPSGDSTEIVEYLELDHFC